MIAQAPNVLDVVAINVTIVGLRAGQCRSHMHKRPKTLQHLYDEFEMYCRFDNDYRMCMEEQNQQKKSAGSRHSDERGWSNPRNAPTQHTRNIFGVESENQLGVDDSQGNEQNQPTHPPQSFDESPSDNPRSSRGSDRGRGGAGVAEDSPRKGNGTTFSTRKIMITTPIISETKRFEAILEE